MAAAIPSGTEISKATATSQTVPSRAGKMPPAVMPSVGLVNRKSIEMTEPPFTMRVPRMSSTGAISSMVISRNRILNRRWTRWFLILSSEVSNITLSLAYTADDQVGGQVNNEGDQEQEDADGEQYLVVIGSHGGFTQFRGNGGGQRAYRVEHAAWYVDRVTGGHQYGHGLAETAADTQQHSAQ